MKTLKEFYQAYAAWLDAGAPDLQPFDRRHGLCSQAMKRPYSVPLNEIKKQFVDAGLDSLYPFGGEEVFDVEYDNATAHLNSERNEWVREHCK